MYYIKDKQITRLITGYIYEAGLSVSGSSMTINTANMVLAKGKGGKDLPDQKSSNTTEEGFVEGSKNSRLIGRLLDDSNNAPILANNGNVIFPRLTDYNNGTVEFFYIDNNGNELSYSFNTTKFIILMLPYRYELRNLPVDFLLTHITFDFSDSLVLGGASGGGGSSVVHVGETVNVASKNSLDSLSFVPSNKDYTYLIINGLTYSYVANHFDVNGNTLSWNSNNTNFDLDTRDEVVAKYIV